MDKTVKQSDDFTAEQGDQVQDSKSLQSKDFDNQSARRATAAMKSARSKKSSTAFRTISEVADDLGVQQHVLRFWETKFSQVKPLKRGGGRRYYRPEDVSLLQAIHRLLYVEGYTIKGVQKLLREAGKKQIVSNFCDDAVEEKRAHDQADTVNAAPTEAQPEQKSGKLNDRQKKALEDVLAELKELRGMIKPRG